MSELPCDLPIDPEAYVGTEEYEAYIEERAKRAEYARQAMLEEYAMDRF